ncbi:MAG: translation initiation factor IF-3 [Negativicutes bacterium]|nr:translation initiation factor IF-3 [Negativicutes bacterium]
MRINEEIRVREVRLVGVNGEQLGIMDSRTALQIAAEHQLDLVEIAPTARPPVCKIMDYGRHKYEQHKREKEAKKKQRVIVVKEVKFRPGIEDHDFTVKMKNARRFLADGDKVKATIMFRGRQLAHPELGKDVLDRLAQSLQDVANVEKEAKLEGRNMTMILAPRASSGRGRAGQAPATT